MKRELGDRLNDPFVEAKATYDTAFLQKALASGKTRGSPSETGQYFLALSLFGITILAPLLRVMAHWQGRVPVSFVPSVARVMAATRLRRTLVSDTVPYTSIPFHAVPCRPMQFIGDWRSEMKQT